MSAYYPLRDYLSLAERNAIGMGNLGFVAPPAPGIRAMAVRTGEFRPPRKGEWYLSGAIVEAYRAPNDLGTAYHIARVVLVKSTLITRSLS